MGIFDCLRKKKAAKEWKEKTEDAYRGCALGDAYIKQKNEALTVMLGAQMTCNHGYEGEREASEDKSSYWPQGFRRTKQDLIEKSSLRS